MDGKYLGKISAIGLGIGGYQDVMFGLRVELSFDGCSGIADWKGTWCPGKVDPDKHTKWTECQRNEIFAETMRFIAKLLVDSKKTDMHLLVGVPVEVEIHEFNLLKSWRILTEVI